MKLTTSLRLMTVSVASLCASAAFASSYTAPVSQEVGAVPLPAAPTSTLSREEVMADLLLWKQAGLDAYVQGEGQMQHGDDYNQRLAHYHALRQSDAFAKALQSLSRQP